MEYTIDRFEENFAVCENKQTKEMINIEKSKLPKEAKEGDIIKFENGIYIIDYEKTEEIRKQIQEKYKNLWQ